MASHRALQQLAVRLADAGFASLRFDWFGCGDSEGASEAATVSQWLADITAARAELLRRRPETRVAAVGLRLGASLAWISQVAADGPLVLWDPVVRGDTYLADLASAATEQENAQAAAGELFGVSYSPTLQDELKALDLLSIEKSSRQGILIVDGAEPGPDARAFVERLRTSAPTVDSRPASYPPGWLEFGTILVPGPVIQMLTKWLADVDRQRS